MPFGTKPSSWGKNRNLAALLASSYVRYSWKCKLVTPSHTVFQAFWEEEWIYRRHESSNQVAHMFLYTTLFSDSGEAGPLVQHQMHGHLESVYLISYFQIACVIDAVILLRAGDKYVISRAYCLVMPTSYYATFFFQSTALICKPFLMLNEKFIPPWSFQFNHCFLAQTALYSSLF